jgi:hypothetical protein
MSRINSSPGINHECDLPATQAQSFEGDVAHKGSLTSLPGYFQTKSGSTSLPVHWSGPHASADAPGPPDARPSFIWKRNRPSSLFRVAAGSCESCPVADHFSGRCQHFQRAYAKGSCARLIANISADGSGDYDYTSGQGPASFVADLPVLHGQTEVAPEEKNRVPCILVENSAFLYVTEMLAERRVEIDLKLADVLSFAS